LAPARDGIGLCEDAVFARQAQGPGLRRDDSLVLAERSSREIGSFVASRFRGGQSADALIFLGQQWACARMTEVEDGAE
jgi:hypothetical protein